jgi:hypothetical protein
VTEKPAKYDKGKYMSNASINEEAKNQKPKNPAAMSHEIKLQETRKPENLRANAVPVDGFVLSVDGKLKTRYESAKDAAAAGAKLKHSYPVIQIAVYDAAERNYTPVEAQET